MPRLLVDRFLPDSVAQFQAVAAIRNDDAHSLLAVGRGTAAIYFWGYAAEMILKQAWFRLAGFSDAQQIGVKDLNAAVKTATSVYGITWPGHGQLHNIYCWAQLVTRHHIATVGPYADMTFEPEVTGQAKRIYERWRESMRYKKNQAYMAEVYAVQSAASWILNNAQNL